MPPRGASVDDRRRYDLYLSAAATGTIIPAAAASSSASAPAGVDAGDLADAVFATVRRRARDNGRTPSVFYAPCCVGGSNDEALDATLQTRGGGVALFLLNKAFFGSKWCVNELLCFLHLQRHARDGAEAKLRLVCVGATPDELRQDASAHELMSRLGEYYLHHVALGTAPAMTAEIVKLVFEAWQSASNVLGATRHDSLFDLLERIPESDMSIVALELGIEIRSDTPLRKNEIIVYAFSSRALGGGGESAVLDAIVTRGSGLRSDSKRMAVEAYRRKWELSGRWEWRAVARNELRGVSISVPDPGVAAAEVPARPQRLIAPANPYGVLLDYGEASTTPEASLKRALLGTCSSSRMIAATSCSPRLAAAQGMGGVGKTCALRGLCFDRDVWERFPDGVFFFTLGQDATDSDVIAWLAELVESIDTPDQSKRVSACASVKAAVRVAMRALRGLRCLLLLDDLWSTDSCKYGHLEELKHLLDSSENSRIVFSTRSRAIASRAGLRHCVPFESRNEETSKQILLGFAGFTDADVEAMSGEAKDALMYALSECRGVPIALAVVGCLIQWYADRVSDTSNKSSAWVQYKIEAVAASASCALGADDGAGEHPGLSAALQQSLSAMDEKLNSDAYNYKYSATDMYRALCVLRKQSWAPASMLSALWGVDTERAKLVAKQFDELSLVNIQYARVDVNHNESHGSPVQAFGIKLHDLCLDFCKQQARCDQDGNNEKKWHTALLCGYLPRLASPPTPLLLERVVQSMQRYPLAQPRPWWSVTGDGYLYKNVVRHLVESGALTEAKALLLEYRFAQAQLRANGIWQAVQDFEYLLDKAYKVQGTQARPARAAGIEGIDAALRAAWPDLSSYPDQLAFQMTGRLHALKEKNEDVAQFIKSAVEHAPESHLYTLSQCFPVPNPALRASISVNGVISVALVPGVDRVVAVGANGLARVLDISSADTVHDLVGHVGHVRCAAVYVLGTATTVVSGGDDGTLRFWDAETGVADGRHIDTSGSRVTAVAATKNGLYVVSVSGNGSVQRWSTETRDEADLLCGVDIEELSDSEEPEKVNAVAVSADGRCVAAGFSQGRVYAWDIDEGAADDAAPAILLGAHDSSEYDNHLPALAMTDDGSTVVSGGHDSTVRVWRVSDQTAVGDPIKTDYIVCSLSIIGGAKIYVGLWDGCIMVYDMQSFALLKKLPRTHSNSVIALDASADGRRLVSCADYGLVRVWDLTRESGWGGDGEGSAQAGPVSGVLCIAASADGRWVVSGHFDGGVWLWDAAKGEVDGEPLVSDGSPVDSIAISPDSRRVVCGAVDGAVRVYDVSSRREVLAPLLGHDDWVRSVTVSPDGNRIVSGSDDQTVRVWAMESGAAVYEPLEGHENWVNSVAVSPDCRYIVSGSEDYDVRVWDMTSGVAVGGPLCGHSGWVCRVEVSGDSLQIVSRSDYEVRIWCISTGECKRIVRDTDPDFDSSAQVLTAPEGSPVADHSAQLTMSYIGSSKIVYSGDASNWSVALIFDSLVSPSAWHYDRVRKRLWAGLWDGGMAIVYVK